MRLAVRAKIPAGVDAVGGLADLVRHLDVRSREAEQPATLVASHDLAPRLERPAEHVGGDLDVAARQGSANGGGADRLLDAVGTADELVRVDVEVVDGAEFAEKG